MANRRLLFVYSRLSTFVKCDVEILEREYKVTPLRVDNTTRGKQLMAMIKLFFYLVFNIYRFNIIYIWFADYHSFLPVFFAKLFRKRAYVVIGGYDACRIKKYNYGSFSNHLRGFMTRYSMNNATLDLCVSKHIARIVKFIAPRSKQVVLYNGVAFGSATHTEEIQSNTFSPKERIILSVAISSTIQSFYIKGIDRFIEAAREAGDLKFVAIGLDKDKLSDLIGEIPANLEIISQLPHDELINYYERAAVYCQLSRSESFGVSLAEAMYYNCMPVITRTGGMPEVTGGYGFSVSGNVASETVSAIRYALSMSASGKLRSRVEEKFTISARAESLLKILRLSKGLDTQF